MGGRPLTGYHVYAFTIPLLLLHLPFVSGVDWSLGAEIATVATYFALAVVWDYLWFVLNPAYTVKRFERGSVWWFEVPWLWRFPRDYYLSILLSIALAALATLVADTNEHLNRHLWMLGGLFLLTGLAVLAAPLYGRWYRAMRREDDTTTDPHLSAARAGGGLGEPAARCAGAAGVSEFAIRVGVDRRAVLGVRRPAAGRAPGDRRRALAPARRVGARCASSSPASSPSTRPPRSASRPTSAR